MIKAAFFDLDGTLLHTLVAIKNNGDRAIERYGHGSIPLEKYQEFIGDGPRAMITRALAYHGDTNEKHIESATEAYVGYFHRNYNVCVEQYYGMYDSVKAVKDMGIRLAVLSNKDQKATEGNIAHFFGPHLFEKIVAVQDGFIKKPAPDEAFKLAEEFGVKPEECVMIGDSEPDILVAKNAGMTSFGVLWGYRTREQLEAVGADHILEKHEEIPVLIRELNKQ